MKERAKVIIDTANRIDLMHGLYEACRDIMHLPFITGALRRLMDDFAILENENEQLKLELELLRKKRARETGNS